MTTSNLTTQEVLKDIQNNRADRTNINNINYNNYNINDITTLINAPHDATFNKELVPIGIASREDTSPLATPIDKDHGSGNETPAQSSPWQMLKIDLFNNATQKDLARNKTKYKIAISALDAVNKEWVYLRASMNGPFRNLKRGLDADEWADLEHYKNLRGLYTDFKNDPEYSIVLASKCYEKGKKGTITEASIVMALHTPTEQWDVIFLFHEQIHPARLSGRNLTDQQRQYNVVGTAAIGDMPQKRKRSGRDLFGSQK
jgi:hypothetical protein